MTVDLHTGEIVEHSTADEARARADRIRDNLTAAKTDLIAACQERDDLALGYDSWQDYCDAEFIEARMIRMDPEQRQEIVASMRQAGMSNHQIASGLGVSRRTVDHDAEVGNVAHLPVKGEDGKTYTPTTRPPAPSSTPKPEAVQITDEQHQRVLDAIDEHVDPAPLELASWRKHFGKAVGQMTSVLAFPVEQVASKADAFLLAEVERAHKDLGNYLARVQKATRIRPVGGSK